MEDLTLDYVDVDDLDEDATNPKEHDVETIADAIVRFGFMDPVLHDGRTGRLIAGHGRKKAVVSLRDDDAAGAPHGIRVDGDRWYVPVVYGWSSANDDEAAAALVALNETTIRGGYDEPALLAILDRLSEVDDGLVGTGYDPTEVDALRDRLAELDGLPDPGSSAPSLAERFGVPPFSVLDSRSGTWQDRKRRWLALGIRSELGRGNDADGGSNGGVTIESVSGADPTFYAQKRRAEARLGRELTTAEFLADHYVAPDGAANLSTTGTSVFDPVLAELAYRWFAPPGGRVLDPFAGGSVRGIVAARLGYRYLGVDLSERQLDANRVQAEELLDADDPVPDWRTGDATRLDDVLDADDGPFDLVFTCPPYADLEVYSDDPADLSTMPYPTFADGLATAIGTAAARLRPGRFVVVVIGEARGSDGGYYAILPDLIVRLRDDHGLAYWNELVYVTPAGSVPVRAGRQFAASRKAGRVHQTVLVLYKPHPDGTRIGDLLGDVVVEIPDEDPAAEFGEVYVP